MEKIKPYFYLLLLWATAIVAGAILNMGQYPYGAFLALLCLFLHVVVVKEFNKLHRP